MQLSREGVNYGNFGCCSDCVVITHFAPFEHVTGQTVSVAAPPHLRRRQRERDLGGRSAAPVHCLLEEGEAAQVGVREVHETEWPAPRGLQQPG